MKKVILLVLWNLALSAPMFYAVSCGPTKEEYEAEQARKIKSGEVFGNYDVVVIDGCEYLSRRSDTHSHAQGTCDQFTHKGNCKNPIHNK